MLDWGSSTLAQNINLKLQPEISSKAVTYTTTAPPIQERPRQERERPRKKQREKSKKMATL